MQKKLPKNHEPYTDKYFLRSREILEKDGLNPWVKMQVFIRKGPGIVKGLEEAVAIIEKYSELRKHGGRIKALQEGSHYEPGETVMTIEGPLQDIIELETMYLGVISAETTLANGGRAPDLYEVEKRMKQLVDTAKRPVMYFGARHWRYDLDAAINEAAYKGGATSSSTDIGAQCMGQKGIGTIPHALVLAYGSTVEAAKAFDRHIDPEVPRVVLIDTYNKEITDALATAKALNGRLKAIRIDTCGENIGEGCEPYDGRKYRTGHGVTVELAQRMREALDKEGYQSVEIILSSGFGEVKKVEEFVKAEEELGMRIFDSLGVGGIYDAIFATADIVQVNGKPHSKTGRYDKHNPRLEEVWR